MWELIETKTKSKIVKQSRNDNRVLFMLLTCLKRKKLI